MEHNTKEEMYESIKRDEFFEDTLTVEDLLKKGGHKVVQDYIDAGEELGRIYQEVFEYQIAREVLSEENKDYRNVMWWSIGRRVEALIMKELEKIVEGGG